MKKGDNVIVLTKFEQRILDTLDDMRRERTPFSNREFLNRLKCFDSDRVIKACRWLEQSGYIEDLHVVGLDIRNASLTYVGMEYKGYKWKERFRRWVDRIWGFVAGVSVTIVGAALIQVLLGR